MRVCTVWSTTRLACPPAFGILFQMEKDQIGEVAVGPEGLDNNWIRLSSVNTLFPRLLQFVQQKGSRHS